MWPLADRDEQDQANHFSSSRMGCELRVSLREREDVMWSQAGSGDLLAIGCHLFIHKNALELVASYRWSYERDRSGKCFIEPEQKSVTYTRTGGTRVEGLIIPGPVAKQPRATLPEYHEISLSAHAGVQNPM